MNREERQHYSFDIKSSRTTVTGTSLEIHHGTMFFIRELILLKRVSSRSLIYQHQLVTLFTEVNMEIPSFSKIIEEQFNNFEKSKKQYSDILSWAERIKEPCGSENILGETPDPFEYCNLLHNCGNAFIVAMLTTMKGHMHFAEAIARIGIDSIVEMAIIETDLEKNLEIWKKFNYRTYGDDAQRKKIENDYENIFRKKKSKHDYSLFITDDEKKAIIDSWGQMSRYGSHVNSVQGLSSMRFEKDSEITKVHTGVFDIPKNGFEHNKALSMFFLIDTYFILAAISSKILTIRGASLKRTPDELEAWKKEWYQFKLKKAHELGIKQPTG